MRRIKSISTVFLVLLMLSQYTLAESAENWFTPKSTTYTNRVPAIQIRYKFVNEFADQYHGYASSQLSLLSELSKTQIEEVDAEYQFWNTIIEAVKIALDITTIRNLSPAQINNFLNDSDFLQVILNQFKRMGLILPDEDDTAFRESIILVANLYIEILKTIPLNEVFTTDKIKLTKEIGTGGATFWIGIGADVAGISNAMIHAVQLNKISNAMYSSLIAHDFIKANICPNWVNSANNIFFNELAPASCDYVSYKEFISTTYDQYADAYGGIGFPGVTAFNLDNEPVKFTTDNTFKLFINIPNKIGNESFSEWYNNSLNWADFASLNFGNYDVSLATSVIESYFALNNSTMYSIILLDSEGFPIPAESYNDLSDGSEIKITTPFHNQQWAKDDYSAEILAYDFHYKVKNISLYKVNNDSTEELITGTGGFGNIVFNSATLVDGENVFRESIELISDEEENTTIIDRYFYLGDSNNEANTTIDEISLGNDFALAVGTEGKLWSWGENSRGQLGNGSTLNKSKPTVVGEDFIAVSAGNDFSLGLKSDGSLWAWGYNVWHQLGDGSSTNRSSPVRIGENFVSIDAGISTSLALDTEGGLWAWGSGVSNTPELIGTGFSTISAGNNHYLALKPDGSLWAWGNNTYGQIGYGVRGGASVDTPMQIGVGYKSISAGGSTSFGIKNDGTLWAWGWNYYGKLGTGNTIDQHTPTQIGGGFKSVAATGIHTIGLKIDNSLWGWGYNVDGQLGDGTGNTRYEPVKIGYGFKNIAAGYYFSAGIKLDGSLWTWGDNDYYQLGDGSTSARRGPHKIALDSDYDLLDDYWEHKFWGNLAQTDTLDPDSDGRSNLDEYYAETDPIFAESFADTSQPKIIAAGFSHSLSTDSEDSLWAWGSNSSGQLGDGTTDTKRIPVLVNSGFKAIVAGYGHNLGLSANGSLWAWGSNDSGQLGDRTTISRLEPVYIDNNFKSIAAGTSYSLAVKKDGTLLAWGKNNYSQLGDGSAINRHEPVFIGTNFKEVAANEYRSYGLKVDGSLWAWGSNSGHVLGDGTSASRYSPVLIGNDFTSIATGKNHSLGIKTDGSLWAWGDCTSGQLGISSQEDFAIPTRVGEGFTAIAAGNYFSLALKSDNSLWAWGTNHYGELGDGTDVKKSTPVKIGDNFQTISTYDKHSLGLKLDGSLWAWGFNSSYQLGTGTNQWYITPVQIFLNDDLDQDNLSDAWERKYFGNTNQNDVGDFDVDTVSNYHEYLEHTDPTDPNDFPVKPILNLDATISIDEPVVTIVVYVNGQACETTFRKTGDGKYSVEYTLPYGVDSVESFYLEVNHQYIGDINSPTVHLGKKPILAPVMLLLLN